MTHRIELTEWSIAPHYPYTPFRVANLETDALNQSIYPPAPCRVPGSIYAALEGAGLIEDPFWDMNSLKAQWVAGHWWTYHTTFRIDAPPPGRRVELVLEGVDYHGHIFVNNRKVGESENMYVPFVADITDVLREGENGVTVVLENAPDEMGQIGYTRETHTQKARFNYKWDWCTRLISIGLYRPAYIRTYDTARIDAFYFKPVGQAGDAEVYVELHGDTTDCRVAVSIDGQCVECPLDPKGRLAKCRIRVEDVRLWEPGGTGDAALYELELSILKEDRVLDTHRTEVGFRHFELTPNDRAPIGALPYVFTCNGRRIYVKGVNLTPIDMTCYNDLAKLEALLTLMKRAHINLIRVWGGGVIEDESFYRLCDRMGIMVWQEFIQSSSGINNQPSKREAFLINQAKTAGYATRTLRNHPSLVVFSGGNELFDDDGVPSDFADRNLGELLGVVTQNCPHIPMLPTSASGPTVAQHIPGEHWDVHGEWVFLGVEEHYKRYGGADYLFHSEFGVNGMAPVRSLRRFLSEPHLGPSNMRDPVWRHHGEWWDCSGRDNAIFGEPDTLERQVTRSQYIQAEGLRFIIEADRRRAFQCSGSIIWQIHEPYPNVCCTSLVDCYLEPKPAFLQVAKAFAPLNVSLQYGKLIWERGETFTAEVYVSLEGEEREVAYAFTYGGHTVTGTVRAGQTHGVKVGEIAMPVVGRCIEVGLAATAGDLSFDNTIRLLVRGADGLCDDTDILGFYPEEEA